MQASTAVSNQSPIPDSKNVFYTAFFSVRNHNEEEANPTLNYHILYTHKSGFIC